jgi:polygalacturonase
MAIGSEMSGGVRHVFVDGFRIPKARHTLYFKANLDRGGRISDVFIRNITAGETASLLVFTNDYHSYRGGNFPTVFERILVEQVTVATTGTGISIAGHPDAPVRDVVIRDVTMGAATHPLRISNAIGTTLHRVRNGTRMILLGDAQPVPPSVPGGY